MRRYHWFLCGLLAAVVLAVVQDVRADDCPDCSSQPAYEVYPQACPPAAARCGIQGRRYAGPWHGNYYNAAAGMPLAVVVPPTGSHQTHWGWGVGATRVTRNWSQFQRNWPGESVYNQRQFRPTPPWPSSTDQFGMYPVRGPW